MIRSLSSGSSNPGTTQPTRAQRALNVSNEEEEKKIMAAPVKATASRTELAQKLVKMKQSAKRANEIARQEGEAMMRNFVIVGSGAAVGAYIGSLEKDGKSTEIQGISIDALAGGVSLGAGMFKWGGAYSDTLSAAGAGILAFYGGRTMQARMRKPDAA